MAATRGLAELERAGVAHTVHRYTVQRDDVTYGEAVAEALGVDPARLFKTLVASVDGRPVVAIVPAAARLSTKRLAAAAGGKHAELVGPDDARRITGYEVGGISPFGRTRPTPVYADASLLDHPTVYVSAGRRGLQVELEPQDLVAVVDATLAELSGRAPA